MGGDRRGSWRPLIITAALLAAWPAADSAAATLPIYWDPVIHPTSISYRIYRGPSGAGPWSLLKTVTATSTRVEVALNTRLCYRIAAVDTLGQVSPRSNALCYTITTEVEE